MKITNQILRKRKVITRKMANSRNQNRHRQRKLAQASK